MTAAKNRATLVRHFRCAIANTASITGSVTSAVRDTTTNTMLTTKFAATNVSNSAVPDFPFAQQRNDGEGKHDRAQQEFLALVDIVLDEDAVIHRLAGDLECKAGINRDDPGRDRHQRAGHQECDEYPHAARRTFEMIEQERQHEQFGRGAQGIGARAPGRVRPQRSQRRERNESDRQRADRPLQRSQERPQFERRGQRGKPDQHADAHAAGRPRQQRLPPEPR